jgi:hypothetical protein
MSSRPELKLDWCTHEAAKYAVENWHYSKSMPVGKTVKVGVWEGKKFIGVVLFAYGANNNIGKAYNLKQVEVCELVRVALNKHNWPVSRILKIAMWFLVKRCSGIRLVVSYADSREGHHGGIYQASNWYFVGTSPGATEYKLDGRWVHSMQVQTFIRKGRDVQRSKLEQRKAGEKHKYLMPLDDEMRKQIEPLRKPYPKRVRSVDSDTSGDQPEMGGANPTRTLSDSVASQRGDK